MKKGHIKRDANYRDFKRICRGIKNGNLKSEVIDKSRCGIDLLYDIERIYDAKNNRTYIWVYALFTDVHKYLDIARELSGTIIRYDGFATVEDLATSKYLNKAVFKF